MQLCNLQSSGNGDRQRISARVTWEDCDRDGFDLFFETDIADAKYLALNANAFLVACIAPAYRYGESRIQVKDAVCRELLSNLHAVTHYFQVWHYPERKPLELHSDNRADDSEPTRAPHAAQLFSGGIDSYTTLSLNRRFFPSSHREYIRTAVLCFGLEQDDPTAFSHVVNVMKPGAEALGLNLVCVYSNIYAPYREEDRKEHWQFWVRRFMGLGLSSQLHALSGELTTGCISASDHPINDVHGAGSSALIDERTSSSSMRIRHTSGHLTRQQKIELVSQSDIMLQHLRVCNRYKDYDAERLNCGRCEKCVRTKLQLLVASALDRCESFDTRDVTADDVDQFVHIPIVMLPPYESMLGPLASMGRADLVSSIRKKINEYKRSQSAWFEYQVGLRRLGRRVSRRLSRYLAK